MYSQEIESNPTSMSNLRNNQGVFDI
jgi:hypothetical protein